MLWAKEKFDFHPVYNGIWLKPLRSLLQKLRDSASLCIKIGG